MEYKDTLSKNGKKIGSPRGYRLRRLCRVCGKQERLNNFIRGVKGKKERICKKCSNEIRRIESYKKYDTMDAEELTRIFKKKQEQRKTLLLSMEYIKNLL